MKRDLQEAEREVARIESLDLEGRGVARLDDGKVAFIEGALPGERVQWARLRAKARFDTGRVTAVLAASPLRVTPRCPHFGLDAGKCGGCSMQHLDARAQVSIKQRVLEETLWHIGRLRPETVLRPVVGPVWNYRHRARLSVRFVPRKGGVLVGFRERNSSYVADMHACPVLGEPVAHLIDPLRELVSGLSIRDRLPQIEVAIAQAGSGPPITVLVLRILAPLSDADRDRLRAFERGQGVGFWLQPAGPDTAEPMDPPARGDGALPLRLPEFGVEIPFRPTDFTQVNHAINEVLVRRALALLDPGPQDVIADFFCGLGNFTLPLATRAGRVRGLEGSAALLRRAEAAAAAAGFAGRVDFAARNLFEWTAADWEGLRAGLGGRIDRVLVDPPREGALAVVQSFGLDAAPPRRVVYVSCNPATLARDCAWLVHEAKWTVRAAGVVNMFPHTSHVESIAVLEPPA